MVMNMYIRKPEYVSALKYVYSEAGIAEMKDFCPDVIDYRKDRHMSAVGKATLTVMSSIPLRFLLEEGDYIIKNSNGEFNIMSAKKFNEVYTIV